MGIYNKLIELISANSDQCVNIMIFLSIPYVTFVFLRWLRFVTFSLDMDIEIICPLIKIFKWICIIISIPLIVTYVALVYMISIDFIYVFY